MTLTGPAIKPRSFCCRKYGAGSAICKKAGLGYLTLDRQSRTLSGGEVERASLTTALGSSLVNTLYILDEPSIGLHARDNHRLMAILKGLRDAGNTIVVVEHDPEIILNSDHVIDLGPKAGEQGGQLIFCGASRDIVRSKPSLTGRYLAGDLQIPVPQPAPKSTPALLPHAAGRVRKQPEAA